MPNVTIYHNPNCETSRNTLALIRHLGIEPTILYYLETPPDEATLRNYLIQMNITPRQLLRSNVPAYMEHGLNQANIGDDELIAAMLADPILINRPIVVTTKGVKLCRPSEVFLHISPLPLTHDFVKENGEVIRAEV